MTVKVLKSWANCSQFLEIGEYVEIPDSHARQLIKERIVVEAPKGTDLLHNVRDISDNAVA